jgi:hypothetical protein
MCEALVGGISEREARLFLIACCRRSLWPKLTEPIRTALDVAERFADERATLDDLSRARNVLQLDFSDTSSAGKARIVALAAVSKPLYVGDMVGAVVDGRTYWVSLVAAMGEYLCGHAKLTASTDAGDLLAVAARELSQHAELIRDIVGQG